MKNIKILIPLVFLSISLFAQNKSDIVHGNLVQFNDNGFWCWFQDERCVVDTVNGKLVMGSDASVAGIGNSARNGAIEAVIYDLKTGTPSRYQLAKMGCDDHNAPGIIIRPDGKYLAMYSAHYDYYKNRYRIFDGDTWSAEQAYDWEQRDGGTNYTIAYNNVYYLSAENRMYDFTRANNRSPNFIVSDDWGDNWTFGGQLTTNSSNSYNKGYYKYWSNGVDRIDYIFTEQHPRDTLTSIYHGYFTGGEAFDSYGNLIDTNITDDSWLPTFTSYTKIFANGTTIGNNTFYRCWTSDLMRYDDGTIAAIITARMNQSYSPGYPDNSINPEHAFIYCRFDGSDWSYTFLDKAGYKFYSSEGDYVGLGALCPNDPNTIYISTPWDARDTTINLGTREIFKGVTADEGATWNWTPITENSTRDNIRPIVPMWNKDNMVLLWCRGTYITAQSFDATVVGIIDRKSETVGKKYYVDADMNTTMADGSELSATGPSDSQGADDNKWHIRTGYGNGSTVFTSSESGSGEDTPAIKTHIETADKGTYDVWVNFWGRPESTSDWRIMAGLSEDNMQIFRTMACKQVDGDDYGTAPVLSDANGEYLYQAYVGRINDSSSFDVYIDDYSYETGTNNPTRVGNICRTWYDGVSIAQVNGDSINIVSVKSGYDKISDFRLDQNYPNPFNPVTKILFNLPVNQNIKIEIFNINGQKLETIAEGFFKQGVHEIKFDGSKYASGLYVYTLKTESYIQSRKMLLIK